MKGQIILFTALLLVLSACTGAAERLWLRAPGWSRAALVGITRAGDPVSVALDETGNMYMLLAQPADPSDRLQLLALDRQARLMWERTLDVELIRPDKPASLWDGESLQLLWISEDKLHAARMDSEGNLLTPPAIISADANVESYAARATSSGQVSVWFAGPRREPGLYVTTVGIEATDPTLVDPEGIQPSLQIDANGANHVVWLRRPPGFGGATILFATYPTGEYAPGREVEVADFSLGPTISLSGPFLGLDFEQAYVFWTLRIATGLEAGTTETRYIHFPVDQPSFASGSERIRVPTSSDLNYAEPAPGLLLAGPRVIMGTGGYPTSPALSGLATNPQLAAELALAFQIQVEHLYRDVEGQVSVAFLRDGDPTGYQLLSFTSSASTDPSIRSDADGYLYVTWLEKADQPGFLVYLAGTRPEMVEALRSVTPQDIGRLTGEIVFGVLSGALLSPIVTMIWLVLPLIILGVTAVIRREGEGLISLGTAISLLLTLLAFWAVKLLTLPGMLTYVPFSAWIPDIPAWQEPILRLGVPLAIAVIAIAVAWTFTFQRARKSAIYFLLIYAAVDGPLTMAVYGVLFYAAL